MCKNSVYGNISPKSQRIINRCIPIIFSLKGIEFPKSLKDIDKDSFFTRRIELKNRWAFFNDNGLSSLRRIVSILIDEDVFKGLVDYSDVWIACHKTIEELLSQELQPEDGKEFIDIVESKISGKIDNYTFVVSIYGVDFQGVDEMRLGNFRIVRPDYLCLEKAGCDVSMDDLNKNLEIMKSYLWIIGSARGTQKVSERKFRQQAELMVGMLAIVAAATHKYGAKSFRIGIIMSPKESYGRSLWMSWSEKKPSLSTTIKFIDAGMLEITTDLISQLDASGTFEEGIRISQASIRNPLEEAIARSIYWFSDAHRDSALTMQFIKYWSCVEVFFSIEKDEIIKSISSGLSGVLIYGGFNFFLEEKSSYLKSRISKLYDLRSRAVHGAAHYHVTERDVADLSQWVAWLIVNMLSFTKRGYKDPKEIKAVVDKINAGS